MTTQIIDTNLPIDGVTPEEIKPDLTIEKSTLNFNELGLCEPILRAISDTGYTNPTPIQAKAIPLVLNGGDLLAGDRLATPSARLQHGDEIDGIVADWCRSLPLAEIQATLTRFDVPHSKVHSIEDVLADPHLRARQALIQLPDPDLGQVAAPCVVPRFSNHTPATPRSGPGVGEHNEEVFGELGLSPAQIAELRARGVV